MPPRASKGLSLIELMVALSIMSVGMLGFVGAFSYLSKSISNARARTIASNLGQEKQEALKKISYYRLVVTTAAVYADETGAGSFPYDASYYPSETIVVAGTPFTRRVYVEKVQEGAGGFVSVDPSQPDTGMKKLTVYVMWRGAGAIYQVQEVRSLYSNPSRQALASTIDGNVTSGGNPVAEVRVECLQNTSFFGITDSAGDYGFKVTPGTYTLRASTYGYYTSYSTDLYVAANSTATRNISITQIATGQVSGKVWVSTGLVVSQVVASSISAGVNQEWIEVFNPTTFTWTIATPGAPPVPSVIPQYRERDSSSLVTLLYDYNTYSVGPNSYFLFANTSPVWSAGESRAADAVYSALTSCAPNCILKDKAGGVGLKDPAGDWLDRVGWSKSGSAENAPSTMTEGAGFASALGLQENEQFVRMTSTGLVTDGYGRSYDSGNNSINFVGFKPMARAARNTSDTETRIAGRPGIGAVVSADDGLSTPTTAQQKLSGSYPYAEFTLANVATGTYNVYLSSDTSYQEISTVTITATVTAYVPNAGTEPAWIEAGRYDVFLDSDSTNGYLTGYVRNVFNSPLSGKTVEAGGLTATTGSDGSYIMAAPEGTYNVNANPESAPGYDADYVSVTSASVVVSAGQVNSGVTFLLSQGGALTGFVTTNGTDPLPNVVVVAKRGGIERGSALSASDGTFDIPNLATGTYVVEPQLDRGETVSPSSPSASVSLGVETFVDTFTVTGAFGAVVGELRDGGNLITTGVLLVATTSTIVSTPPNDDSSLRAGAVLYYATSSLADGAFRLEVRGGSGAGTTYNVYAWYTTWSGSTPNTVRKTTTATVTAGANVTKNFTWP